MNFSKWQKKTIRKSNNIQPSTSRLSHKILSTLKAKEVIKEKGMTIEEVASKMGITKGTLSAAISGNPTIGYLERVANAIDCDIKDLFK